MEQYQLIKTKEFFNFGSYYLQCMQSRVIFKNSMQRVLILRKRYIADEEKRNCDCVSDELHDAHYIHR